MRESGLLVGGLDRQEGSTSAVKDQIHWNCGLEVWRWWQLIEGLLVWHVAFAWEFASDHWPRDVTQSASRDKGSCVA